PDRGRLAGALEVQQGPPVAEWIIDLKSSAIPTLSPEVGLVRIARVVRVDAVGQGHQSPLVVLLGAPRLPDSSRRTGSELPAGIQPAALHVRTIRRLGHRGMSSAG